MPLELELPEPTDSTRLVALARLPARILKPSPHAPKVVNDYREFQDGEVVPGTRYRVCRLIGAGGMGRVYEVEHQELGKRFVLKALLRELSRREDLVARLRNEWRALARLEHPNIVNVTDAGMSDNGVPFYVMERLEGETLSALLHRHRRLLPHYALTISAGILEGLHAAHQIGVVHRDVKPPNIFLTAAGAVKVLDFGIAKVKDAQGVITARGIAVGTPRYMSPEQAQGSSVDARSDVYATGLMLFEMVSGVGPFDDAKDNNELLLAQLGRKAPLLSSVCVVAPELDAIVASMLAKDPRERPASARHVAETLRELSQRYEHFVETSAPTVNVTPRPATPEPPTRVEGQRRSANPPPAVTRPDGPAAFGRAPEGDPTALQPALETATTAAHVLPAPGVGFTQRLAPAPLPASTFHGPDTLVDPLTKAPTAVPQGAPERTERLLVAPPVPGGAFPPEPGPTRTAVPAVDAPNLTPPPVVPSASVPPRKAARPKMYWGVVAAALAGCIVGGAILLRPRAVSAPAAPFAEAVRPRAAAPATPPPPSSPSVVEVPQTAAPTPAVPSASVPLQPKPRDAAAETDSAGKGVGKRAAITEKSEAKPVVVPGVAEPAPAVTAPAPPKNRGGVAMPGSGL